MARGAALAYAMHKFLSLSRLMLACLPLGACVGTNPPLLGKPPAPVYTREAFQADEKHSRLVDAPVGEACESARRALLSQGYVVAHADERVVQAVKRFQPEGELHVEIGFHVVCAAEGPKTATLFVSAQQDHYALKKNHTAATVGVSALGTISMPLGSSNDSLVKVASETIPAGVFYDRFFALVQQMLRSKAEGG